MGKKGKLDIYTHTFKIHAPKLLEEVINNALREKMGVLQTPLTIFAKYLYSIAERCAEIDDPILNRLMVEMALYSVGSPHSEDYDPNVIDEVIKRAKEFNSNNKKK